MMTQEKRITIITIIRHIKLILKVVTITDIKVCF